ncbi:NAD(P)-binding domain-containing protein [Geminicoccaceae bacterium 1502E]|nr:NAD(P)-binding domain-containing protein [Geminicoccaceae bacterium 1502E]
MARAGIIGEPGELAVRARDAGLAPVVHATEPAYQARLDQQGIARVDAYEEFFDALEHPRVYLIDMGPGPELDRLIDEAYVVMEPGDVVVDPGASWWCDTLRRFRRMRHRSLYYVDAAAMGGIMLASGDRKGVELALPVLEALAGRAAACGEAGAAHYAAMVLDGLRTVRAQAESEARQLLEAFPAGLDAAAAAAALGLADGAAGGRAAWLPEDALRLEAAVPLTAQAVMLELAAALDEHRSVAPAPRLGPFVRHEEIL